MGLDPERLNVFVASLKRHSPHTQLVVFVEEQTEAGLLRAAGAEVITFKMPSDSALVLHRLGGKRCSVRATAGWVGIWLGAGPRRGGGGEGAGGAC